MRNILRILGFILLLVALGAGIYLVQKNQETRRGAAANATSSSILPSNVTTTSGQPFNVSVWLDTGSDADKLLGAEIEVPYDATKLKFETATAQNGYQIVNDEINSNGVLTFKMVTIGTELGGAVEVLKLSFTALGNGSGSLAVKAGGKISISDGNAIWDIATNNASSYTGGSTAEPTVEPTAIPTQAPVTGNGTDGILKFRVTIAGIAAGGECAKSWPVKVMVMWGDSQTKTFETTIVQDGTVDGRIAYKGEVLLAGVPQKNNLAIFVKGRRTLQTKFGKNGQSGFYNQPGGVVEVTADLATTPVNDFTKYPILPGDVTGKDGVQDGSVDGVDFASVKEGVNKRTEGNNLMADLNGNCKLESQDLFWLMASMKDKQEQLY